MGTECRSTQHRPTGRVCRVTSWQPEKDTTPAWAVVSAPTRANAISWASSRVPVNPGSLTMPSVTAETVLAAIDDAVADGGAGKILQSFGTSTEDGSSVESAESKLANDYVKKGTGVGGGFHGKA